MNNLLIKIQNELKVPKGNWNDFGKFKYRSAEDILEFVKPILTKYECCLMLSDEVVECGNRVYIKATASIRNKECNVIYTTGFARDPEIMKGMSEPMCTGTASSYARKYALNGLFCIDETAMDADSRKGAEPEKKEAIKPKGNYIKASKAISEATEISKLNGFVDLIKKSTWTDEEDQLLSDLIDSKKKGMA